MTAGEGPQLRIALDNYYICEEKGHNPVMCDQFEIPGNKHTVSAAIFLCDFWIISSNHHSVCSGYSTVQKSNAHFVLHNKTMFSIFLICSALYKYK